LCKIAQDRRPKEGDRKMDKSTLWFLYMSFIYLAVGAVLGLVMIFAPATTGAIYRVHAHINLLGWVSMMIFGVAYHILPRFSGRPMRYPKLIWPHFWLSNGGLVGMALVWSLAPRGSATAEHLAGLFGLLASVGVGLFVWNMLCTVQAAPPPPAPPPRPSS
jgi:cytochrome c oxidase cbb3-type subunit 1